MTDIIITINPGSATIKLGVFACESGQARPLGRATVDEVAGTLRLQIGQSRSEHDLPSGAPLMTAKDLLAKGKDDQYVRLKGKLTSHKGDEDYEFTDASGKIMVEIDADRFPAGVTVDHNTLVELTGEFDKEMFGDSTVDVEQIKVVAQ